jgi:transcriptional regulator with XRE-family HTH domain
MSSVCRVVDVAEELREFLMSRRGRLRPDDVGLVAYGDRRRVPGLRREELAQIAGVSITHYTRLEQGHGARVSDDVLDAVAGALRLTTHEHAYLHRLARACGHSDGRADEPPELRPGLVELLESLVLIPAAIIGHHTEIVRCNRLFVEVYGPVPATFSDGIFLDPNGVGRRIAPSWDLHAGFHVALLRASMAQRPHDGRLQDHVARMRSLSPVFDDLWQQHQVVEFSYGEALMVLDHPSAGRMVLSYEHLVLPGDPSLHGLHLWTAEPGTASHAALRSLANVD